MDARAPLTAASAILSPATALMDRLTPTPHGSRIPATPAPDYAAGLAFHSLGHGSPVLLLHGLASSRGAFNPIFTELARHHRVIAVDLPGHGDSHAINPGEPLTPRAQAYALGEFLDVLGLAKVHVVGNSLGGWVGLELAADDRVLSYTGLCPAGLWRPLQSRSLLLEFNRHAAQATGRLGEFLMLLPALRELVFAAALARPYRLDYGTARAALAAQRAASGYDEAHDGIVGVRFERAREIPANVPVTIAFGDDDQFLPPHTAQLQHLAPLHARWVIMPRVGHAPMWDDPEGTLALVRTTIAGQY
jgi:pimeloyl-ACP methyl ester carboxylesterase